MTFKMLRLIIVASGVLGVQLAHAHAYPAHQAPAAGATVARSTSTVSIEFDEPLEPALTTLIVTNAAGEAVTTGKSQVAADDKKQLSVKLNPLTAGVYAVSWIAVAADGHRTQGHYTFTAN